MDKRELQARYDQILPKALERGNRFESTTPLRVEAYLLQAALGKRPLTNTIRKINQHLHWVEKKDPKFYEKFTSPNPGTKISPYMQLRNQVFPPQDFMDQLKRESRNR